MNSNMFVALALALFGLAVMIIIELDKRSSPLSRRLMGGDVDLAKSESLWLINWKKRIGKDLAIANVRWTPDEYISTLALAAVGAVLISFIVFSGSTFTTKVVVAIILEIPAFYIPRFIIRRLQAKRIELMEKNMPEVLISLIQALESGQSLTQAIGSIAETLPYPMNEEFLRISHDIRTTNDIRVAIEESRIRIPTESWGMCSTAIVLQIERGAKVVDVLRQLLRDVSWETNMNMRMLAESSGARSEAMIMVAMPVLTFLLLKTSSPMMSAAFSTPVGYIALFLAIGVDVAALIWARNITNMKRIGRT